jgi:hypothetical protein
MTEKLKNAAIQSEFTTELERRSPATRNQLLQLKEQHARLVLPTQTLIDRLHALVVDMIQGVAAKVLSSPNPAHRLDGHPMRAEARDRKHQRPLGHDPLLQEAQEIQQQKDSVAELQSCEITGPDDPMITRIEVERLKLHDLKLKLAVAKQMEVDLDITNATKDVSVQTDKDQMQTAWGIWRHYRSSISTDGCHGLPSRMKTNTLAATDPARWRASEIAKSQGEGAQAWHQYRYAIGHHLRNHPQSPWDEAAANAVEAAAKLPHAADAQIPDTDLNAPFVREELCSDLRRLLSGKATGPDGLSNRMLQLGGDQFINLLFLRLSVSGGRVYTRINGHRH